MSQELSPYDQGIERAATFSCALAQLCFDTRQGQAKAGQTYTCSFKEEGANCSKTVVRSSTHWAVLPAEFAGLHPNDLEGCQAMQIISDMVQR